MTPAYCINCRNILKVSKILRGKDAIEFLKLIDPKAKIIKGRRNNGKPQFYFQENRYFAKQIIDIANTYFPLKAFI